MLNGLRALRIHQRELGLVEGSRWHLLRAANRRGFITRSSVMVHPPQVQHALSIRMRASSDPLCFNQIFVDNEFGFVRLLQAQPKLVFDLGANVGYASAFFLSAFPDAFVLAVEPEQGNIQRCGLNLAAYGARAKIVNGAVWHTPGGLVLVPRNREWATEVRQAEPGERADVMAWDIPSLLDMCPHETIDLLKIDIEGSERALFSKGTDRWLNRVRNICIELHGRECESVFRGALEDYEYASVRSGEYHVCLNLRPKGARPRPCVATDGVGNN